MLGAGNTEMNRWSVFSDGLEEKNAFGGGCVQFEESKAHLNGGVP